MIQQSNSPSLIKLFNRLIICQEINHPRKINKQNLGINQSYIIKKLKQHDNLLHMFISISQDLDFNINNKRYESNNI